MLSVVLLFGLSLCRFDLTLNRLLGSLIFICRIGGKRVAILIDLVMGALNPQPEEVAVDLYCGAGTFTLPLVAAAAVTSA